MNKKSIAVLTWRRKTKDRMVAAMGGKCQICGYNRCNDSLEFHHIDPLEKTFTFAGIRANPKKWEQICDELEKCILLCANCHREVEAKLVNIPSAYDRFDTRYRDYKLIDGSYDERKCEYCDSKFITTASSKKKYCNKICSNNGRRKVNRPSKSTIENELKNMTYCEVGRKYGVSDNTIRKWLK